MIFGVYESNTDLLLQPIRLNESTLGQVKLILRKRTYPNDQCVSSNSSLVVPSQKTPRLKHRGWNLIISINTGAFERG
jgi:hypothetical protein